MKKIYSLLLVSTTILMFSQSKDELNRTIDILKKEKTELESKFKKCSEKTEISNKNSSNFENEINNLKDVIRDNNIVFFDELFENKYKKNPDYFNNTELNTENDVYKFKNSIVFLKNIIEDTSKSKEDIELAKKAIVFSELYIKFYELRESHKDFFYKKYDSKIADKYVEELSKINVDDFNKLKDNKKQIINDIKNYENSSCHLKNRIETLLNNKNVSRDEVLKNKILNFKNDYKKEFKYLQNIILETSKYPNNYNSESLNCIQNEMKQEVKESSTKKE